MPVKDYGDSFIYRLSDDSFADTGYNLLDDLSSSINYVTITREKVYACVTDVNSGSDYQEDTGEPYVAEMPIEDGFVHITHSSTGKGKISAPLINPPGNDVKVTLTADSGSHIESLKLNDETVDVGSNTKTMTYTMKNLVADARVSVVFAEDKEAEKDSSKKEDSTEAAEGKTTTPAKPTKPDAILVNKIKVTGISHKIAAGKKIKLTATVLPANAANKKLKWTSSNKKYVTVTQAGVVKIKKKGSGKTVIIKATATDGSGKSATWKIKIMKGAVSKITIKEAEQKGAEQVKAGGELKLKATVKVTKGKPVNKKLKWTSSNKKWATVTQSGKVKTKKAGKGHTVKITAMATDGTNKKAVIKIKIK